jgi:hypothetical protein
VSLVSGICNPLSACPEPGVLPNVPVFRPILQYYAYTKILQLKILLKNHFFYFKSSNLKIFIVRTHECLFSSDYRRVGRSDELSSPAETPSSWVRIPLAAWMSVCVYSMFVQSCVQVVAYDGLIPYPENHTDCVYDQETAKASTPPKGLYSHR